MIVCNRCGKENQDHYKFCLGCGADITAGGKGGDVGMMKTMMADTNAGAPSYGRGPATGPTLRPAAPGAPLMPPPGPLGPPVGGPTAPPMGPPPGVPGFSAGYPPPTAGRPCPTCQTFVPAGFRFCGACGYRMEESVMQAVPMAPPPIATAAPAYRLTLIRPDGSEGGYHDVRPGENRIGRLHGPMFESDGYLSPNHAELTLYPGQGGVIRDLASLNGVFVKMRGEEELVPGQIMRVGQELLRFELVPAPELAPDGTEVMGSPNPGYWGRLVVVIGHGIDGPAHPLLGDTVTIGRDRGEINFPDDGYVSGVHARVSLRDGRVFLMDAGSSNGTFIKVNGERRVDHDSFILLGQQLFRLSM